LRAEIEHSFEKGDGKTVILSNCPPDARTRVLMLEEEEELLSYYRVTLPPAEAYLRWVSRSDSQLHGAARAMQATLHAVREHDRQYDENVRRVILPNNAYLADLLSSGAIESQELPNGRTPLPGFVGVESFFWERIHKPCASCWGRGSKRKPVSGVLIISSMIPQVRMFVCGVCYSKGKSKLTKRFGATNDTWTAPHRASIGMAFLLGFTGGWKACFCGVNWPKDQLSKKGHCVFKSSCTRKDKTHGPG
jgi:hypothetical protein